MLRWGLICAFLFGIIPVQRGFFSLDSSRDILGFTHITVVVFNQESRILQSFLLYITGHI